MIEGYVHPSCRIYGISKVGRDCTILENVVIGYPDRFILKEVKAGNIRIEDYPYIGASIGDRATIRPNTTIYCNVTIGDGLNTGHNAMVRESTVIGDNVLVGTNVVIDGNVRIGNNVSIQSNAYIPTNTAIEDNVFLGPCCVLTNDKYPIRMKYDLRGPVLRKGASLGANCTILPGVEIGEGAMVAAGSLVTKNVPPWSLAMGSPAKVVEMKDSLKQLNRI